jgi:hypothetical protein
MPLDTLDNVKLGLGVTGEDDDSLLTRLMDHATAYIRDYCGKTFAGGSVTEYHPAGRAALFLANFPVDSVDDLRVDANRAFGSGTTRTTDTFVVHPDRGVVESLTGPFLPPRPGKGSDDWPRAVKVTYTIPDAAVPTPVAEAFTQLVGFWYRQVKTNVAAGQQLLIQKTDADGTTIWSWSLTAGLKVPPGVYQLLNPYRVPAI